MLVPSYGVKDILERPENPTFTATSAPPFEPKLYTNEAPYSIPALMLICPFELTSDTIVPLSAVPIFKQTADSSVAVIVSIVAFDILKVGEANLLLNLRLSYFGAELEV